LIPVKRRWNNGVEKHWEEIISKIVEAIENKELETLMRRIGQIFSTCVASSAFLVDKKERENFIKEMCQRAYLESMEKLGMLEKKGTVIMDFKGKGN